VQDDALVRALVARHPQIERIATGHFHRPIVVRWAGTVGFVAPSTAHQVVLDLRETEPTRLVMEPRASRCTCIATTRAW
jgi:hypothetical protein